MATFIRPERVEITEGGTGLAPAAVLAGAAVAVAAVVAFVLAHLLLIVAGLAAAAAVTAVTLRMLSKHATVIDWAPRPAVQAATVTAEAIPVTAQPVIEAPQIHQHIHFHGVPAEDIATILGQAHARPALREHLS